MDLRFHEISPNSWYAIVPGEASMVLEPSASTCSIACGMDSGYRLWEIGSGSATHTFERRPHNTRFRTEGSGIVLCGAVSRTSHSERRDLRLVPGHDSSSSHPSFQYARESNQRGKRAKRGCSNQ